MTAVVRAALDAVEDVLLAGSEAESRALWDILAALRGPDNSYPPDLKDHTTVPIRRAAFPRLAARSDAGSAETIDEVLRHGGPYPGCFHRATFQPAGAFEEPVTYNHFGDHARQAANALGLLEQEKR